MLVRHIAFAVATLAAALFAWESRPRSTAVLPDASADALRGAACWYLPAYKCPQGFNTLCSTTLCTEGVFSWYCADGTAQKTYYPAYVYCTEREWGSNTCDIPDQNNIQPCQEKRACGTDCLQSTIDGLYYCTGPVGPVIYVTFFPVPVLGGGSCATS